MEALTCVDVDTSLDGSNRLNILRQVAICLFFI